MARERHDSVGACRLQCKALARSGTLVFRPFVAACLDAGHPGRPRIAFVPGINTQIGYPLCPPLWPAQAPAFPLIRLSGFRPRPLSPHFQNERRGDFEPRLSYFRTRHRLRGGALPALRQQSSVQV